MKDFTRLHCVVSYWELICLDLIKNFGTNFVESYLNTWGKPPLLTVIDCLNIFTKQSVFNKIGCHKTIEIQVKYVLCLQISVKQTLHNRDGNIILHYNDLNGIDNLN